MEGRLEFLAGHAVAGDVARLVQANCPVPESWITGEALLDTLLCERLVDENRGQGAYELETLVANYLPIEPWKHETVAHHPTDATKWPPELRQRRCGLDAQAAAWLAKRHLDLARLPWVRLVHRIASTIDRVCTAGMIIDMAEFDRIRTHTRLAIEQVRGELGVLANLAGMPDFSPTNDGHLRELLFERLRLEPLSYTKTGKPRVDKTTLAELDHPVAKALLTFSDVDKLWTTAFGGVLGGKSKPIAQLLRQFAVGRGYLPLNINPLGARTGRRASHQPNCQNWEKEFRRVVTSRWAGGLIGDFDYSKLEVVLIAWAAGDAELLEYFTTGAGYVGVAKWLWGRDVEPDSAEYRATKSIVLGVNYGMGATKMARNLWFDVRTRVRLAATFDEHARIVAELRKRYLRRFAKLRQYADAREAEMLETGQVVSAVGQVRHLPNADPNNPGYGHMLNQAVNFPIQCLASYVTGSALVDVEAELLRINGVGYYEYLRALLDTQRKWLTADPNGGTIEPTYDISVICNEVHDDVVVDLHPAHLTRDTELVVETMRAVPSLRKLINLDIPLRVGVKTSPRWCGD